MRVSSPEIDEPICSKPFLRHAGKTFCARLAVSVSASLLVIVALGFRFRQPDKDRVLRIAARDLRGGVGIARRRDRALHLGATDRMRRSECQFRAAGKVDTGLEAAQRGEDDGRDDNKQRKAVPESGAT